MEVKDVFAVNLRVSLARTRLKQKALAECAGVPVGTIARLAAGKNVPTIDTLKRISDVFQVPPEAFLSEEPFELPVPFVARSGVGVDAKVIASNLRRCLDETGLTTVGLAKRAGLSQNTAWKFVSGGIQGLSSVDTLRRISGVFGLPMGTLLSNEPFEVPELYVAERRVRDSADIFVSNLRRCLVESGLSQDELARQAGLDASTITRYVKGERVPSMQAVERLASVFQLSAETLLSDASFEVPPLSGVSELPLKMTTNVRNNVEFIMLGTGMSVPELSTASGLSGATLYRFLENKSGNRNCVLHKTTLNRLSRALQMPVEGLCRERIRNDPRQVVAKNVTTFLDLANMSYDEFAKKLNVRKETLLSFLAGEGIPNGRLLQKISRVLDIPLKYLFAGVGVVG